MYDHVNAMVQLGLQLRKEMESSRTKHARPDCMLLCKASIRHANNLHALISATAGERLPLDAPLTNNPAATSGTPVAGFDLAHPDVPPTFRFTGRGDA